MKTATQILIKPNPSKKPAAEFERVTRKGMDGAPDDSVKEDYLTRAPRTKFVFTPSYSISLGGINSGLLDLVDNDYIDEPSYRTQEWKQILKGVETISRQTLLEYKHGRKPGFYSNQIKWDLNKNFKGKTEEIPYYQTVSASKNLNDGLTVLDLNKPEDEVLYYGMLASDLIANSMEQMTHRHGFFIAREDEEQLQKQKKSRLINGALAKLEEIMQNKDGAVVNFCKVVGGEPSQKRGLGETQAYDTLERYIKKNVDQATQFDKIYTMYTKDPHKFTARVLLWNYETSRIINTDGAKYTWQPPRGEDGLIPKALTWDRREKVLDFLVSDKYQPEQDILEAQYKAANRI